MTKIIRFEKHIENKVFGNSVHRISEFIEKDESDLPDDTLSWELLLGYDDDPEKAFLGGVYYDFNGDLSIIDCYQLAESIKEFVEDNEESFDDYEGLKKWYDYLLTYKGYTLNFDVDSLVGKESDESIKFVLDTKERLVIQSLLKKYGLKKTLFICSRVEEDDE